MPFIELRKEDRSRVRRYDLPSGEFTIGRSSSNALALHDLHVSRHHCVIDVTDAGATIRDLDSTRGLKVNLEPTKKATLKDGDCIFIGPYELTFYAGALEKANRVRSSNPLVVVDSTPSDDTHDPLPIEATKTMSRETPAAFDPASENRELREDLERAKQEHAKEIARSEARIAAFAADVLVVKESQSLEAEVNVRERTEAAALIARLKQELVEASQNQSDARASEAMIGSKLTATQAELAEAQSKVVQLREDSLQRESDRDASKVQEIEAMRSAQAAWIEERALLVRSVHTLESHVQAASAAVEAVSADLTLAREERDTALADSAAAGVDLASANDSLAALRAALDAAVHERDGLRVDIDAARAIKNETEDAVAAARIEIATVELARRQTIQDAERLEQNAATAHDQRAHMETELRLVREDLLRNESGRAKHEADLLQSREHVTTLEQTLASVLETLRTVEAERVDERGRLATALAARAGVEATDAIWREQVQRLEAELASRDEALVELTKERANTTGAAAAAEALISEFRTRVESLDHGREMDHARIVSLETALVEADSARRSANKQATLLQANRDEFKQRVREVETRLGRITSELALARSRLDTAQRELSATRERSTRTQTALVDYLRQIHAEDDIETSIVELSDADIARAQSRGATLIELDDSR